MKLNKVSILKEEQVKNENILDTLKKNGVDCYCSDLARITGTQYNAENGFGEYWIDGQIKISKSKNSNKNDKIYNMNFINSKSTISSTASNDYKSGVRIAFSYDDIEGVDLDKLEDLNFEYPLTVLGGRVGETVDKLFSEKSKLIMTTGRNHYVDGNFYREYEVFGIKFIKKKCNISSKTLSDGTISKKDTEVYLKVEEIPFTFDKKQKIAYSSVILYGSNFDGAGKKFEESKLNKDLNNNFLKSINDELEHDSSKILFGDSEQNVNDQNRINNRYNFDYSPLTEEDIIEICINTNTAVFVHGKTGVGKTERMLSLDKNLELIDFGCTSSDGFTGIIAKDFNSRELFLYEPYWYKNLCKKCADEPNKIHILFLEELTNARSDVQKVAFEVTLNKTLTNSGFRLKLPENAVVCAAGNEASESKSATSLSEPLFGRFAHVYIDTDSEEWLKWALKRKKENKELIYEKQEENNTIHPAIIDFIKVNGDKALRTKYDGKNPNADPRKWALASKALYKSNNPNVLRAFVGENVTSEFIKFSQMNLVTVDDILNDKCDVEKVPFDPSLRWYTTMILSYVDDENVDKVRSFVSGLGKEFLAVFDYEWSKDNDQRIMKLYNDSNKQLIKKVTENGNK